MKAWICRLLPDRDCATVVFAETRGKAKVVAMNSDSLGDDVEFLDVEVQRIKELDQYYRGCDEMDWFFDDDRVAMVKIGGFSCDPDYFDLDECETCSARSVCDRYKEYIENEREFYQAGGLPLFDGE